MGGTCWYRRPFRLIHEYCKGSVLLQHPALVNDVLARLGMKLQAWLQRHLGGLGIKLQAWLQRNQTLSLTPTESNSELDSNDILVKLGVKLQALIYDILPSTTAVFSYVIGSWKLSANEQFFFVGAQTLDKITQNSTNNHNPHPTPAISQSQHHQRGPRHHPVNLWRMHMTRHTQNSL